MEHRLVEHLQEKERKKENLTLIFVFTYLMYTSKKPYNKISQTKTTACDFSVYKSVHLACAPSIKTEVEQLSLQADSI